MGFEDGGGADGFELVHNFDVVAFPNHDFNSPPLVVFQDVDSGGVKARCDSFSHSQFLAQDGVFQERLFTCVDDAFQPTHNTFSGFTVVDLIVLDEHGFELSDLGRDPKLFRRQCASRLNDIGDCVGNTERDRDPYRAGYGYEMYVAPMLAEI